MDRRICPSGTEQQTWCCHAHSGDWIISYSRIFLCPLAIYSPACCSADGLALISLNSSSYQLWFSIQDKPLAETPWSNKDLLKVCHWCLAQHWVSAAPRSGREWAVALPPPPALSPPTSHSIPHCRSQPGPVNQCKEEQDVPSSRLKPIVMFCQLIMAGLSLPDQQQRQLLNRKRIPRGLSYKQPDRQQAKPHPRPQQLQPVWQRETAQIV